MTRSWRREGTTNRRANTPTHKAKQCYPTRHHAPRYTSRCSHGTGILPFLASRGSVGGKLKQLLLILGPGVRDNRSTMATVEKRCKKKGASEWDRLEWSRHILLSRAQSTGFFSLSLDSVSRAVFFHDAYRIAEDLLPPWTKGDISISRLDMPSAHIYTFMLTCFKQESCCWTHTQEVVWYIAKDVDFSVSFSLFVWSSSFALSAKEGQWLPRSVIFQPLFRAAFSLWYLSLSLSFSLATRFRALLLSLTL